MSATVTVSGATPYDVHIGTGAIDRLTAMLGGRSRVAVIHTDSLAAYADTVLASLRDGGFDVLPIVVPDAEAGKSLAVAGDCWDALGAAGFTRDDAVVTVGGGAVTDLPNTGTGPDDTAGDTAWLPLLALVLGFAALAAPAIIQKLAARRS